MAQSESKVSFGSIVLDLILVAAFFVYLFTLLRSHVPSNDPFWITLWAALGSLCMSGVFWLCVQMFRVVLRAQREANRK